MTFLLSYNSKREIEIDIARCFGGRCGAKQRLMTFYDELTGQGVGNRYAQIIFANAVRPPVPDMIDHQKPSIRKEERRSSPSGAPGLFHNLPQPLYAETFEKILEPQTGSEPDLFR
jgi:hypothetical protein